MAKTKAKAAPKAPKITAAQKRRSKGEIYSTIAEHVGVTRKQVAQVFDVMGSLIGADLAKGSGEFAVPGLMRIKTIKKPATKARKGTNPFTGEPMTFKAKPARKIVRARPVKAAKDAV